MWSKLVDKKGNKAQNHQTHAHVIFMKWEDASRQFQNNETSHGLDRRDGSYKLKLLLTQIDLSQVRLPRIWSIFY